MPAGRSAARKVLLAGCLALLGGGPINCGGGSAATTGSGGSTASGGATGSGGSSGSGGATGSGGHDAGSDATTSDTAADIGHDAEGSASFTAVLAIFAERCVRCHDPAHPFVLEAPTFVDTPLTPALAYDALVGKPAHETCGGTLVKPGDPAQSYLFHKVNDPTPCDGKRMPHPGMLAVTNPLPAAQLDTIAAWIRGGAMR